MDFIDYVKPFDSVETLVVIKALKRQEEEKIYVKVLKDIYVRNHCYYKVTWGQRENTNKKGFRQGDIISPKLFTAVLEEVFKNLEWEETGIEINGEYINNIRLADTVVLMSESTDNYYK